MRRDGPLRYRADRVVYPSGRTPCYGIWNSDVHNFCLKEQLSFTPKTNQEHDCEEESEHAKVKTILHTSDFKQIKLDIGTEEEEEK